MDTHEHKVSESSLTKTEYVDVAEAGNEGCVEHYNERVIVTDVNYVTAVKSDRLKYLTVMQKAVLLGETLSTPRAKRPFGKK